MPGADDLVIIARSGRALAQSACRAGWRPCVIDAFVDMDTRACAPVHTRISMNSDGHMDEGELRGALAHCEHETVQASVIYGAGMESMPGLLEALSARYRILGNTPEVLRAVRDPITFSAALRALRIPYPRTRFTPPRDKDDELRWLVKRASGAGGGHVQDWNGAPVEGEGYYFQHYLPGPTMSALFAADGRRATIIGFNTQWVASRATQPFAYAGAVNRAGLTVPQRDHVANHVNGLTRAFGLRGLNSLDFILYRDQLFALEINPRPTATCELYEPDRPDGMVALHVRACQGELPDAGSFADVKVRAHAIVYAHETRVVSSSMQWPSWCRDIPEADARIGEGEPVCSVHAEGAELDRVRRLIDARRGQVPDLLRWRSIAA